MPLAKAINAELVCKQFSYDLRNSLQYQALITDWAPPEELKQKDARSIFLEKVRDLEFQVHLADLWRNYFPLGLKDERLPLTHYWETYINLNDSYLGTKLHSIYRSYNINNFIQKNPESTQRAELGEIITSQTDNIGLSRDLRLFQMNQNYSPQILNEARVDLIITELGTPHPDYANTRGNLTAIVGSVLANSLTKAKIHFYLAEMDRLGQGIPQPDFTNARVNYEMALNNSAISPEYKAMVQFRLDEMEKLSKTQA